MLFWKMPKTEQGRDFTLTRNWDIFPLNQKIKHDDVFRVSFQYTFLTARSIGLGSCLPMEFGTPLRCRQGAENSGKQQYLNFLIAKELILPCLWTLSGTLSIEEYLFHWEHIKLSRKIQIKYSNIPTKLPRNLNITACGNHVLGLVGPRPLKPLEERFC